MESSDEDTMPRITLPPPDIEVLHLSDLDAVQAQWTTEALERLQPVLEVLTRATTIDEAYRLMGKALYLGGSAQLRGALMQRLQQR